MAAAFRESQRTEKAVQPTTAATAGGGQAEEELDPSVVPANAGTHSHRPLLRQKVSATSPYRWITRYGSLRQVRNCAQGRDDVECHAHVAASLQFARGFLTRRGLTIGATAARDAALCSCSRAS